MAKKIKKIDTETIVVNLLREDKENYCTLEKIQKLCAYIYEQLIEQELLDQYSVKFAVDFESIERTVLYNSMIFDLDSDGSIVSIREPNTLDDLIPNFEADFIIVNMIRTFNNLNVA